MQVRIERLAAGNPGDVRPVGEGVSELRIDYGPGYRVYFKSIRRGVVVSLAGGRRAHACPLILSGLPCVSHEIFTGNAIAKNENHSL